MAKLNNEWFDELLWSFETEEEVFDFVLDRMDTSDFEDSYMNVGGHGDHHECIKITASDKRQSIYDFMMHILQEVQQYRAIGTPEECRAAVEKQNEERNKAIDDFVERLNAKCDGMIEEPWNSNVAPASWAEAYKNFKEDVEEVAEQLKGCGVNE